MIGAQDVRPGAASQSRPKRGRGAADLACASFLTFEPQVGFPVQLKLQMMRKCRNVRLMPRAAPRAIANSVREPAGPDCNGEPLSGLVAGFAFSCGKHSRGLWSAYVRSGRKRASCITALGPQSPQSVQKSLPARLNSVVAHESPFLAAARAVALARLHVCRP